MYVKLFQLGGGGGGGGAVSKSNEPIRHSHAAAVKLRRNIGHLLRARRVIRNIEMPLNNRPSYRQIFTMLQHFE